MRAAFNPGQNIDHQPSLINLSRTYPRAKPTPPGLPSQLNSTSIVRALFYPSKTLYNFPMKGYSVDIHSDKVKEEFVTIYAPRRQRDRFPENCVTIMASETAALAAEDATKKIFAAKALGPCRSSEGLHLFYLVKWLSD